MNSLLEKINKLPPAVNEYLTSLVSTGINGEISEQFKLPSEKISKLTNLQTRVFTKEIPVSGFVDALQKEIGLDDKQTKALALQVTGRKFLMVDDYFNGEASQLIKSLGGQSSDFKADLEKQKIDLATEKKQLAVEEQAVEETEVLPAEIPARPRPEEKIVPVTTTRKKIILPICLKMIWELF